MDKQTVLEDFQHYSPWLSLLEDMEEETWTMPIAPDKWSCGEIITHITKWDNYLLSDVIPSIKLCEDMSFPEFDSFNAAAAAYARSGLSKDELLQQARETRERHIIELYELPAELLYKPVSSNGETHCPHTGTPYSLLFIITDFTWHDRHHQEQIETFWERNPVYIKQAGLENMEGVSHLFDAYRMFYNQASNQNGAKDFLKERLKRQESVLFFAGGRQGYLGFIQLYPSFSSISMQRTWILNDLYIHPDARNRGVAAKLLNYAREFAVQTGAKEITLCSAVTNEPAKRLYEKHGYREDTHFSYYELLLQEKR